LTAQQQRDMLLVQVDGWGAGLGFPVARPQNPK